MSKTIDHIGIAVSDFDAAADILGNKLNLHEHEPEEVPDQKVVTLSFSAGGSEIELLKPASDESPIAKFIAQKGQGIHHIALRVDDLQYELDKLASAGVKLIDEKPRMGAGGKLIAFIHPKSAGGILIELTQLSEHDKPETDK
ncbi:methylmalonyl-CoA epimerase [bacterium]|nr:methylmalonyl-CoA epimerase [FCB group bacterium]MBL7191881.1 methylmalonyl-CoA epimerase [bacterium]